MLTLLTCGKSINQLRQTCREIEMSVFKEKNGRCEGANPLGGPATAGRFAETRKARLQTRPGRFTSAGAFFNFTIRPRFTPRFCKQAQCALACNDLCRRVPERR
jgi:hypothetical protein